MIKCKQVMKDSICGKTCCCLECEERDTCEVVCDDLKEGCPDAFEEKDALAVMTKEVGAVIQAIADLTTQKKKIEDQEKEMKAQLLVAMEKYGVKSFENNLVKFMYVAATTQTKLDSKALKKDMPDVAAKYSKTSNVSAYVKITVKK